MPRDGADLFAWYIAGTVFAIWNVFQSNGLDVRLLGLGGILPLVIDVPFGRQGIGHTLIAPVLALGLVMLATPGRGRRLVRRRWIALPIGWMCGTALSGAFANQKVFWWPAFGWDFGHSALLPPLGIALLLEALGLAAAWWCWVRFDLADPAKRSTFLRTGRVTIDGPPPAGGGTC